VKNAAMQIYQNQKRVGPVQSWAANRIVDYRLDLRVPASAIKIGGADVQLARYIQVQLERCAAPWYPELDDPILTAIKTTASHMNEISRFKVSPVERGIVLFQAARDAMHREQRAGRTGQMHRARADEADDFLEDNDDATGKSDSSS